MGATTQRRLAGIAALLLLLTALQLVVSANSRPALATDQPTFVEGNPTCADFGPYDSMLKIEAGDELNAGDTGEYTSGALVVEIVVYETADGWEFDWSANHDIAFVVAKGGPGANLYTYSGARSDSGLHAPFNTTSGTWYGLSHISFCAGTTPVTDDTTPVTGDTTPDTNDTTPETPATTPETGPPLGAIGDYVWLDVNRNGRQDDPAVETPVPGATVQLLGPSGSVLATQLTGADGLYLFDDLPAGNYRVQVAYQGATYTLPKAPGVPEDRNSDVDPLGDGVGRTALIGLDEGEIDLTWDAGIVVEVLAAQIESTTTTTTAVEPVVVDTLPFTGSDADRMVALALAMIVAGVVMLRVSAQREGKTTFDVIGSWPDA